MTGPPDLQKLVEHFGGYDRISAEAWAEFDRVLVQWRTDRREALLRDQARAPTTMPPVKIGKPVDAMVLDEIQRELRSEGTQDTAQRRQALWHRLDYLIRKHETRAA